MRARNNFTAIGHLGQAPEMRTSARSQKPVVRFSVAVNHVYVSDKGERQQQTEWLPIVVFREKLCDICMRSIFARVQKLQSSGTCIEASGNQARARTLTESR